jgi:hypothetical protein
MQAKHCAIVCRTEGKCHSGLADSKAVDAAPGEGNYSVGSHFDVSPFNPQAVEIGKANDPARPWISGHVGGEPCHHTLRACQQRKYDSWSSTNWNLMKDPAVVDHLRLHFSILSLLSSALRSASSGGCGLSPGLAFVGMIASESKMADGRRGCNCCSRRIAESATLAYK